MSKTKELGNLYASLKPGDCLRIGQSTVHVVAFTGSKRVKLRIEAPEVLRVECGKSLFERLSVARNFRIC